VTDGRARWQWVGALGVGGITLFLCYLRVSDTEAVTSDGSAIALQAWDMLHGNWLLRGWDLADVTFYTTELPEYVLVESARGLNPGVVHVAAALTCTVLVLLAGLLARSRATGREGVVRFLIAAGIMLAPQHWPGAFVLLLSPDHIGTEVPLLVLWLILDRAPRRWYVPVITGLLLTWVEIGDPIVVLVGVAPLAAVCLLVTARELIRRRAVRGFELSLAAAAIASVALSAVALRLISAIGGFTTVPVPVVLVQLSIVPKNLLVTGEDVLSLYGASLSGGQSPAGMAFAVAHLAGVALAVCALVIVLWRFFRLDDLIAQVMAVAIIINLVIYAATTLTGTGYGSREIDAVLPLGAVLAGRLLGGAIARARLLPVPGALLACSVAALGYGAAQAAVPAQETALASWLAAHDLHNGLAGPESNVVTLDSGGRIHLLVMSFRPPAAPDAYQSKDSWYYPWLHDANFVVTAPPGFIPVVPQAEILASFGRPALVDHYQGYTIMIWQKNLLAHLAAPR
jgi:hypothetical protein